MDIKSSFEQNRREDMRWRILQILDKTRGSQTREMLVWRTLDDLDLVPSITELRRELHYLSEKGLIKTSQVASEFGVDWRSQLTAQGIDFVEYTSESIPGIARPGRYWQTPSEV